jgi:hypothetical protein
LDRKATAGEQCLESILRELADGDERLVDEDGKVHREMMSGLPVDETEVSLDKAEKPEDRPQDHKR